MSDWNLDKLSEWDEKICKIAKSHGLDWYPIIYETCDYYEMIGNMAYHGMPTHYSHWSFGKTFERTHNLYNAGMEGLPYELIINSDPSIAYLMRENPMFLQVLIMCHCVGHSDFFKNNFWFQKTDAENIVPRMRNAKKRIQKYIEDPSIGIEKVEEIIDAAHTIQYQIHDSMRKRLSHDQLKSDLTEKIKNDTIGEYDHIDIEKIPLESDHDILAFIIEHARTDDWKKEIMEIVSNESHYFVPQMKTKIMNEGWASYWHYRLMHELDLPQGIHIPFLKSHNQVIRPHLGTINPYHLGFNMFKKIEERHGLERCFFAREVCHDASFIREYLTEEDIRDMNLFTFSKKKEDYTIDEISDIEGWESIKNDLISSAGTGIIPKIYVDDIEDGNILVLRHNHDGRDLDLNYADEVVRHISLLWNDTAKLITVVEGEPWEI
jgi:stage V sporulation protein R